MMQEFKVNDYITLKLENNTTVIYVDNKRFNQCKFLLMDGPAREFTVNLANNIANDLGYREINSAIDFN